MRLMTAAFLTAGLAMHGLPASAALSGYWESSKVLYQILGDANVADALKQQPIESITKTDAGYRLTSRNCAVDVRVTEMIPARPGPAKVTVRIGKGRCE